MTQRQAMLCAFAAFFGWVLVDTSMKLSAHNAALPPSLIMGVMGLASVLGLVALQTSRSRLAALKATSWKSHAVIATMSLACNYFNIIALKYLPLTIFYIVVFTAPFVITGLSALCGQEKLTRFKLACLVVGFAGVVLALGPGATDGAAAIPWIGYAAGLASMASFAVYTVVISKISDRDSNESILLSNAATCTLVGLAASTGDWGSVTALSFAGMVAGGLLNLTANALFNKALAHTAPGHVAQVHYTQLLSGALIGYLLWDETPTLYLLAGAALIVASGIAVAARARRNDRAALAEATAPLS